MKDYSKNYPGRAMRVVWVSPGKQVQAYDCSGGVNAMDMTPFEYVWVPEEGYSCSIDSTFGSKKEAIAKAIRETRKEIDEAQDKLQRLIKEAAEAI